MIGIWRSCIAKYSLAIWLYFFAKCTRAIWQHPNAKHTLAILATSYCLNRKDRVSSFYKTRGSKLCFLTCFSSFSSYFLILVFLQKCSILISLRLSQLHGNLISTPISCKFWQSVPIICQWISGHRAFLLYLAISCQIAKFSCFYFFHSILPFSITGNYFKFELQDSNSCG